MVHGDMGKNILILLVPIPWSTSFLCTYFTTTGILQYLVLLTFIEYSKHALKKWSQKHI